MSSITDSQAGHHIVTRGSARPKVTATVTQGSASTSHSSIGHSMSDDVVDPRSGTRRGVKRRKANTTVVSTETQGLVAPPIPSNVGPTPDIKELRRMFNKVYSKWSRSELVDAEDMTAITSVYVTEEDFLKLTESRELAKYIALIDYRIRFDEIPKRPHGEVLGYVSQYLGEVFRSTTPAGVLFPASDNDVRMYAGSIKRPDASYLIRPRAMPDPPPGWIQFLRDDVPYPNVVVEVAVNNEGPTQLRADCHRYFSNATSVCVWIGIKVWVAGENFWAGWAERAPAGNRATIHTNMRFPPHHHPVNMPVNLVYHIPMQTVYGNGIPIPPNSPPTLDIDCDAIRRIIEEFL